MPPLAAGTWNSAMRRLRKKVFAGTDPLPKLGTSSMGARGTVLPVVMSVLREWAAAQLTGSGEWVQAIAFEHPHIRRRNALQRAVTRIMSRRQSSLQEAGRNIDRMIQKRLPCKRPCRTFRQSREWSHVGRGPIRPADPPRRG